VFRKLQKAAKSIILEQWRQNGGDFRLLLEHQCDRVKFK